MVVITLAVLVLILLYLTRLKPRPTLRECLDAIEKQELRSPEADEFENGYCHIFYSRQPKKVELLSICLTGSENVGRGTIAIAWIDEKVTGWSHAGSRLPNMTTSENYLAAEILRHVQEAYFRISFENHCKNPKSKEALERLAQLAGKTPFEFHKGIIMSGERWDSIPHNPNSPCLQPKEFEQMRDTGELPIERRQHLDSCQQCQEVMFVARIVTNDSKS